MAWSGCLVPETETEPGLLAEIRKQMGAVPEWISRVAAARGHEGRVLAEAELVER